MERLPRRQLQTAVTGGSTQTQATVLREPTTQAGTVTSGTVTSANGGLLLGQQAGPSSPTKNSQFLLAGSVIYNSLLNTIKISLFKTSI